MIDEIKNIEIRYAKRSNDLETSSVVPLHRMYAHQEKERAFLAYLRRYPISQLSLLKFLEIGCGYGHNLTQFVRWGFDPCNMIGSELLPDRTEIARHFLPPSISIVTGDSSTLDIPAESMDIVLISTVFSSILDDLFQEKLASVVWDLVRPGGAILWYDFIFNNPQNQDVRGVPRARIEQLFPRAKISLKRVTLAPPIARALAKCPPPMYAVANMFPFFRSHVIGSIVKPASGNRT